MSLGIAFKGPEGIVIAADSRVILNAELTNPQGQRAVLPAAYDNATKLLRVNGQDYVGVVTYGLGAIGGADPRTAHSYVPEFEKGLQNRDRLSVRGFAEELGHFFMNQWQATMPKDYVGPDMVFLIGGYDPDAVYGSVFEVCLPSAPNPKEWHPGNQFGAVWGGQKEFADRLIQGYDPRLKDMLVDILHADQDTIAKLNAALVGLSVPIPYQFLPLQDCVDLSIFLIRTTMTIQKWQVGIRGVGGFIDVAIITRAKGFQYVQQKSVAGENC